jgi:hypothetical protein
LHINTIEPKAVFVNYPIDAAVAGAAELLGGVTM